MSTSSEQIRHEVTETLRLSLVGPDNRHSFARELLPEPPTRWYLTGFLVAKGAPIDDRSDPTSAEEIDAAVDASALDDASPPERASARRAGMPSSLALSWLAHAGEATLKVLVSWGDSVRESLSKTDGKAASEVPVDDASKLPAAVELEDDASWGYRRVPEERVLDVSLPTSDKPERVDVHDSSGLVLYVTVRDVAAENYASERLPKGAKSVSVFLVNERPYEKKAEGKSSSIYQATLRLESTKGFVPRPDLRGSVTSGLGDEWDERIADLHYRDVSEYDGGHGVSARTAREENGSCRVVESVWIPEAEVDRVAASTLPEVVLGMEDLSALGSLDAASIAL